jgi:hypothetical protein
VYILQKDSFLQSGTLANAGRPERVKNKQKNQTILYQNPQIVMDTLEITFKLFDFSSATAASSFKTRNIIPHKIIS